MAQKRKRIPKSTPKATQRKEKVRSAASKEVTSIILCALGLFVILAFYFKACGPLGQWILEFFTGLFGYAAYALPVLLIAAGVYIIFVRKNADSVLHIAISGAVFFCVIAAFFHLWNYSENRELFESIGEIYDLGQLGIGGGLAGALLVTPLYALTSGAGTVIILSALLLCSFVVMTDFTVTRFLAGLLRNSLQNRKPVPAKKAPKKESLPEQLPVREKYARRPAYDVFTDDEDDEPAPKKRRTKAQETQDSEIILPPEDDLSTASEPNIRIYNDKEKADKKSKPSEDFLPEPDNFGEKKPTRFTEEIPVEVPSRPVEIPYTFPTPDILTRIMLEDNQTSPENLRQQANKLVETLQSFGVEAKVLEISRGPSVTRFELQPKAGVKVSKITGLADDIALNLAAYGVRIEAPIPGKAAIGIEIPNQTISTVSIRDVLESKEFSAAKSKLSIALGRDIAGKCVIGDIAKMPHVLIAGATGSGKSVCINSLIASILYKATPNEVRLVMIDPKVVELNVYNGIPHLLIPVVTDPRKAAGALNWAVQEMTLRYKMFADAGVRDLKGYNALMKQQGDVTLPQIVIIIDELADLMMVAPKDVEDYICRLAQLARAAGMHLVIATQRPSVDVITGVIKANIPSRIAFAVSSQVDSRTILDHGGAEKLLGKGDMLYFPMGASKATRVQGAFISDSDVEALVDFVKTGSEPVYDEDILEKLENAEEGGEPEADPGDSDELLPKAIEIVIDAGQASVSLVQRRLKVGYSRAGRIIDQMEERGIIGPHEGSKPRTVLMTRAQYYAMKNDAIQDESLDQYDDEDTQGSIPFDVEDDSV